MRITFLGTSASLPTKSRALSAVALEHEGDVLLFDCGEATQMQMLRYKINLARLRAIFITHIHGDHSIGIAGVVRTLALGRRTEPLRIFVPRGAERAVRALIRFDGSIMGYRIAVEGIGGGTVYKSKDFVVRAFRLRHSVATYGYAFVGSDRTRFDNGKCAALGIRGRMFSELQRRGFICIGKKTIRLESVSRRVPGKRVVYAVDTRPSANTVKVAEMCDMLIHDATYASELASYAAERMHSTAAEAAAVAKKAKAKALALTHISARYSDASRLLEEAKKIFPHALLAHDGLAIQL